MPAGHSQGRVCSAARRTTSQKSSSLCILCWTNTSGLAAPHSPSPSEQGAHKGLLRTPSVPSSVLASPQAYLYQLLRPDLLVHLETPYFGDVGSQPTVFSWVGKQKKTCHVSPWQTQRGANPPPPRRPGKGVFHRFLVSQSATLRKANSSARRQMKATRSATSSACFTSHRSSERRLCQGTRGSLEVQQALCPQAGGREGGRECRTAQAKHSCRGLIQKWSHQQTLPPSLHGAAGQGSGGGEESRG